MARAAQDALTDTWLGDVTWDPAKAPLDLHLKRVIRSRTSMTMKHLTRFPRVAAHAPRLDLEREMSDAMEAERTTGPAADLGAFMDGVVGTLYMLGADDDDVLRILDCFNDGLVDRRDILRATKMTATTYHNARRRLFGARRASSHKPSRRSRPRDGVRRMIMNDEDNKSLRIYEAVSYESALDASERGAGLTLAEHEEARRIVGNMREMVLAKQRAERAVARVQRVRPSIFAMARDAMEARFNALFAAHPDAVIAHRDLTALTDDDLRTALEDAETLVERLS